MLAYFGARSRIAFAGHLPNCGQWAGFPGREVVAPRQVVHIQIPIMPHILSRLLMRRLVWSCTRQRSPGLAKSPVKSLCRTVSYWMSSPGVPRTRENSIVRTSSCCHIVCIDSILITRRTQMLTASNGCLLSDAPSSEVPQNAAQQLLLAINSHKTSSRVYADEDERKGRLLSLRQRCKGCLSVLV